MFLQKFLKLYKFYKSKVLEVLEVLGALEVLQVKSSRSSRGSRSSRSFTSSTECVRYLDKLNLVLLGSGGLVFGLSLFLLLLLDCSENVFFYILY